MNYVNTAAQCFLVLPLVILFAVNILTHKTALKYALWFGVAMSVFEATDAAALLLYFLKTSRVNYNFEIFYAESPEVVCHFTIKLVSLFLMVCIGIVSFVSTNVALRTITSKRRSYTNLLMCLLFGMNGMVMATDLFSLYVFLEIVGISSFVMIAMFRSRTGLEGSFKYLVVSAVGVMLLLTGLSFLLMQTGSLEYAKIGAFLLEDADVSHKALTYSAIILMITGFCVKAGAAPFHSWLPDAHQSADTAISVLLSGIVIKIAGVYGLIVVRNLFGSLPAVAITYRVIGLLSVICGALLAYRQTHFKRICAYSSVSQMGYIILGLSVDTKLGLLGALLHVLSHALFKTTLFANAAAIHEQVGILDITKLGGLGKKMPVTAFSGVIAFLSTAGIPPLCGFWSKMIIILAVWQSGHQFFAMAALVASILTAAYFLRLQKYTFFGITPPQHEDVTEITGSVKFIEIVLTAGTIGIGLAYPAILILLQNFGIIV